MAVSSACSTVKTNFCAWPQVVQFANFVEASSNCFPVPTMSLVEGSITTEHDRQRIADVRASRAFDRHRGLRDVRRDQALRNGADVAEFTRQVYAHPEYISTLATEHADVSPCQSRLRTFRLPISKTSCWVVAAFCKVASHGSFARGLRRLQATRDAVPDGDARRSLSWPSHARRLPGAVSQLRSRLFWLLWTQRSDNPSSLGRLHLRTKALRLSRSRDC